MRSRASLLIRGESCAGSALRASLTFRAFSQTRFCPNRRAMPGVRRSARRTGADQHRDRSHSSSTSTRTAAESLCRSTSSRPEPAKHAAASTDGRCRSECRRAATTAATPASAATTTADATTPASANVTAVCFDRLRPPSAAFDFSFRSSARNGQRADRYQRIHSDTTDADTSSCSAASLTDQGQFLTYIYLLWERELTCIQQLRPEVFMKSLFDVMRKRGQPITGTPYIEGKEVDLYQLYQAVMLNGGSELVSLISSSFLVSAQLTTIFRRRILNNRGITSRSSSTGMSMFRLLRRHCRLRTRRSPSPDNSPNSISNSCTRLRWSGRRRSRSSNRKFENEKPPSLEMPERWDDPYRRRTVLDRQE